MSLIKILILALLLFAPPKAIADDHSENKTEETKATETQTVTEVKTEKSSSTENLFDRLGKTGGIVKVVNDFVENVIQDKRVQPFFAVTANNPKRVRRFKKLLALQICEASGGTCKYSGKSMKEAHKNMKVQESHFNILVEHLTEAMIKNGVGKKEQSEVIALIAPMKEDIVEPWPELNKEVSDKASSKQ